MIIEDSILIAAPLDAVWKALGDVPRVAQCIPGARIEEIVDERTYRCAVAIKVGPVAVSYRATLTVVAHDDAAHRADYAVSGKEARGRGGVNAQMSATASRVGPADTRLDLRTDAKLSGIIVTVGGRLIEGVAKRVSADFARNLSAMLRDTPS